MAGASIKLDVGNFDDVLVKAEEYGGNALSIINEAIHNEAGQEIRDAIKPLIPRSGRDWKGKKQEAASTNPFAEDDKSETLAVTVKSKTAYNYLYFPDDGSNTKRHAGNQQFFARGAEAAAPNIISICLGRLAEAFDGG